MVKNRIVTPVNYPTGLFLNGYNDSSDKLILYFFDQHRGIEMIFDPQTFSKEDLKEIHERRLVEIVETPNDTNFTFNCTMKNIEFHLPTDAPLTIRCIDTGFSTKSDGNLKDAFRTFMERWNQHGIE